MRAIAGQKKSNDFEKTLCQPGQGMFGFTRKMLVASNPGATMFSQDG